MDGRRPPLWREFLEKALVKCEGPKTEIKRLIKGGDYLTACQLIKTRLGIHTWHDTLEEQFLTPAYLPDKIHQAIFDLDLPVIATTNVDTIYDRFLNGNYSGAAVIKPYHDDAIGRYLKGDSETRLVIKVHGSVDNLDKTIFTRQEYADARYNFSQFYTLLTSLISTQTFIFIGYSLADPDINLLLEENSRRFKSPRPHYLLTSDSPSQDMKRMFAENYSIQIIKYSMKENHQELVDSLFDLSKVCLIEREKMGSTLIW